MDIFPPSSYDPTLYAKYLKLVTNLFFLIIVILDRHKPIYPELTKLLSSRILSLFKYYPKDNVCLVLFFLSQISLRNYIISCFSKFCSIDTVNEFSKNLPLLCYQGIFVEEELSQNNQLFFNGLSRIISSSLNSLSLQDIRCIVLRYCSLINNPRASFSLLKMIIEYLYLLLPALRPMCLTSGDGVSKRAGEAWWVGTLLFRVTLTYIRKIDDIQLLIKNVVVCAGFWT